MVVDELGLVRVGEHITVFIPATQTALVFRVRSRANAGGEVLNYGPLPIRPGTTLPTYDGGSVTVPAEGVLPARSYTPVGVSFPMPGAYDPGDMWYTTEEDRDRLFHVKMYVHPPVVRVDLQVPVGVTQGRFQRNRVTVGVDKDFGFSRGYAETVHLPAVRYGYRFGNDTNLNLRTFARFVYGEYVVEIPRNPELVFDILVRRVPSYWVTLPVNFADPAIESALTRVYGTKGFPVLRYDQRDEAVDEYRKVIASLRL